MSVLSIYTGHGDYKVIDDASGKEIGDVIWVDDQELEYAFHDASMTLNVIKVTAVSVNHTAREIHVNTPQPVVLTITVGHAKPQQGACDECCDESACRRCNLCLRYRCAFGEVAKP